MIVLLPQTRDEKRRMYAKLKKAELIEMLINANEALDRWLQMSPKVKKEIVRDVLRDMREELANAS